MLICSSKRVPLSVSQPLSRELADSTKDVQEVGGEVAQLQGQVDALREEQEKLLKEKDNGAMLIDVHSPLVQSPVPMAEQMPSLIDLCSPSEMQSTVPPSADRFMSLQQSHDLLGTSVGTSDQPLLGGGILQPEVLTDKQSQELF